MLSGSPPKHQDCETPSPLSESVVKETHRISIDYNPVSGRKKLNTYEIIKELGRGEHGRVKLGYDVDKHIYVAIKLLNRKEKPRLGRPQGSSTEEKIHREIAILKKCCHPNIVRLIEVLDDESSRKIYLVLEYCAKGEIRWQTPDGQSTLSREHARSVARNVALGLEYLHANGIIHRDIKPANLLVSEENVVKISDFGVSYAVLGETNTKSELELAKTVGTPAFFSPELCIPTEINDLGERKPPPISSKVDVWAFGVTLYCFLYGYLPFEADNEYELFRVIANEEVDLPDPKEDDDLRMANDLLKKLLTKDPIKRPTISEIKNHPWLLKSMSASAKNEYLNCAAKDSISVSNEEVDEAVKGVNIKSRIKQGLSRIAEQMRPRSRSRSRSRSQSRTFLHQLNGLKSSSNKSADVGPASNIETQRRRKSSSSSSTESNSSSSNISQTTRWSSSSLNAKQATNISGRKLSSSSKTTPPVPQSHQTKPQQAQQPQPHSSTEHLTADLGVVDQKIHGLPGLSRFRRSSLSMTDADSLGSVTSFERQYHSQPGRQGSHVFPHTMRGDDVHRGSGIGLMPMSLGENISGTSPVDAQTKDIPLQNLSLDDPPSSAQLDAFNARPRLPEIEIPRLDNDSLWGVSSSSSDDDDSGELTLVVGRNRSRSVERRHPSTTEIERKPPQMPSHP